MSIISSIEVFLETGFVFSIIAMGYYITYHILDFPDLTVEGTFLSGAVVFGLFVNAGLNPWLGLFCALVVGALFGTITGILHVKLNIRPLLCGILVSTSLITLNLIAVSAGTAGDFSGQAGSSISFGRTINTLHDAFFSDIIPSKINNVSVRDLVIFFVVTVACKIIIDLYLNTKNGLLLRAVGSNEQFAKMLGINPGKSKIIGLAIGNACAAVSGALYTHISGNVNQSMGVGTIVIGLASLIIGISLFRKVAFLKSTTKVIVGAIIYQACLTVAQKMGVPSAYNKMIMALMFTVAIILSNREKKNGGRANA